MREGSRDVNIIDQAHSSVFNAEKANVVSSEFVHFAIRYV